MDVHNASSIKKERAEHLSLQNRNVTNILHFKKMLRFKVVPNESIFDDYLIGRIL